MNISFDWVGGYLEHKPFFDEMAKGMQLAGHRVGVITGERESKRGQIMQSLGFVPDFMCLWGDYESIANGYLWKCKKMDSENVLIHFDDDATEMKKYTDRWIIKTMCDSQKGKF